MMELRDRRLAARFPVEFDVELHERGGLVAAHVVDVSRHGLFVGCRAPPAPHQSILITVKLPSGAFETLASVARRVEDQSRGPMGAGLKLFCLGTDAKVRWDRFVAGLESPGLELPTRATSLAAVCFLVRPPDQQTLLSFFNHQVLTSRTLYVTPALRQIGAEVCFTLVHPHTHEEHAVGAAVVDWNPDQPRRMGVRFDPIDIDGRRAFLKFLGPVPASETPPPPTTMDRLEREKANEYAYVSPKLQGLAAPIIDLEPEAEVVEDARAGLFDFNWSNADDASEP